MTQRHILGLANPGALRVVVLAALGAAFVAACGGGGTGDADGSGGSGGSDTATGGSTTGSGGSSTSTGGTSTSTGGQDAESGGASTGGAENTGGDGGFGGGDGPGSGGSEGNSDDCPETLPGPEDTCQGGFNAPTCTYGDQECECQGFGENATWSCGEATEEPVCPEEAPEDGATCTEQQACNFGGGSFCFCNGEEWNCP